MTGAADPGHVNATEANAQELSHLLCACRQPQDFARLYELSAPTLSRVLSRILHRRALVEEALQDVFVKIWQQAGMFDPSRGSAIGWMIAVARNHAIDSCRRASTEWKRQPLLVTSHEADAQPVWPRALVQRFASGVMGLSQLQQLHIHMAFIDDRTHREIAALTETSLGSVKSSIRRGLLRLRTGLVDAGYRGNARALPGPA